ncbi:beta-2 adrenergic receptor-like [Rhopilema esculentum]|uniref:beta-2 adrenergic receptor-like n=1 Tax=Rhopilema esculentum TaxID=499914 RepID=UPI0031D980CD|eukprot:gene13966-4926_t
MNCSWSTSCLVVPEYMISCTDDAFKYNILINCIVNFLFAVISTVLNGSVIWVIFSHERLWTTYYMILLSLAITDFTAGILAQPLHIARLAVLATKGQPPCALDIATVAIGYTLPATSFFTVSYVTLERFLAIFYPFYHERRCTSKSSLKMIVLIWIIGASYGAVGCLPYKQTRLAFIVMVTVIGTFFLLWNSFAYSKIFIISRKIRRKIRQEQQRFATDEKLVKEAKAAKTTFVVVATLFLFYGPAFTTTAVSHRIELFPKFINIWAYTLMLVNSAANPLVYCFFCQDIGREMKKLWYRVRVKSASPIEVTSNNPSQQYS